jgi:predicted RNA-binding protein with PUA-like domain
MAHWLLKSEPETWSWDMQKKKGAKGEPWSGVRNHQAKRNLMAMKKGERGFFYHSGKAREIVGIVEVIGEYRPDPSDASGKFGLVIVKAVGDLPKPVTLADAKVDPVLARMTLVTFSRLSVQPVTDKEWQHICKLGGAGKLG